MCSHVKIHSPQNLHIPVHASHGTYINKHTWTNNIAPLSSSTWRHRRALSANDWGRTELTLTGEMRVATGRSLTAVPGGEAETPAAHPASDGLPSPFRGRCLIPSSNRTRRMLAGKSSTAQSTRMRHSGQRSSWRELTMFSRQRRQKVCWQGSTRALVSSRSRHTEHSSRSSSDDSSILCSRKRRAGVANGLGSRALTRREWLETYWRTLRLLGARAPLVYTAVRKKRARARAVWKRRGRIAARRPSWFSSARCSLAFLRFRSCDKWVK